MSQTDSDFENVAEEKIKKLKMRNSELVAIARKLEEKAKQLQEEKDLLEVSIVAWYLINSYYYTGTSNLDCPITEIILYTT